AALKALAHLVLELGYRVKAVELSGALHLKTACTHLGGGAGLAHRRWANLERPRGPAVVEIDPSEPFAANVLRVGDALLVSSAHPRTNELLARRGLRLVELDVSEFAKAEAGLTCLCLLVDRAGSGGRP